MSEPKERPYQVWSHDAFHLMGDAEAYKVGEFDSCEEALTSCRKLVDDFLRSRYRDGMTADELFTEYRSAGPEPFIRPHSPDCAFSAQDHARQRCGELCGTSPDAS